MKKSGTKRPVAIIAPFIDKSQFHADFTLRLARNSRELTLAAFYELAGKAFNPDKVSRGIDYGEDIPAAGFYLEGLLRQNGYDTILTNKYDADTINAIAGKDPFCVCVSATMIITTDSLIELFASIRKAMPGIPIIAGGVFIWKNYLHYLKHIHSQSPEPLQPWMLFHPENAKMEADILVVAPHGRGSLLNILEALEKGSNASFGHISNLCLPGENGFHFTQREEEPVDYNEDFIQWELIDSIPLKIPLRTSIGCYYHCRFCDFYKLFPRVFLRSTKSLSMELGQLKKRVGQNLAVIHVSDENVFASKKRLFDVCGAIEDSELRHWIGFMRGGEYSGDEMAAIKRSGLMMGKIGVESGDPDQLMRMNKQQKIENVKKGVEQFDANGISTLLTFVVGFPGETRQTLSNTADFLNSLSLSNLSVGYQLYPLVIFPLSELAEPSARAEWKIDGLMETWSHYTMNSKEAVVACHELFRDITNVPYSYPEESYFFNQGKFNFETRRSLFQLRHQLTLKLIGGSPWDEVGPVLESMATQMRLSTDGIGEHLVPEISVRCDH